MSRVYYKKKALRGKPYEGKVSLELFNKIVYNLPREEPILKLNFMDRLKGIKMDFFSNVWIHQDNFDWHSPKGLFYLPNSICMSDYPTGPYGFPKEYYFIACIEDVLEVRQVTLNDTSKHYYEVVNLDLPLESATSIQKLENSVFRLYKTFKSKIERPYTIPVVEESPVAPEVLVKPTEASWQLLLDFLHLCTENRSIDKLVLSLKKVEMEEELDKDEVTEAFYNNYHALSLFIDKTVNTKNAVIAQLDWSFPLDEFKWVVEGLLARNFGIDSPKLNTKYDAESPFGITGTDVFRDFGEDLIPYGLCMGFIDWDGGDYMIFLHKIENQPRVKAQLEKMGFGYYDASET